MASLRRGAPERFEKQPVRPVSLRVVFCVPLHAQREAARVPDADRLDRVVFGDPFDKDPLSWLQDRLAME